MDLVSKRWFNSSGIWAFPDTRGLVVKPVYSALINVPEGDRAANTKTISGVTYEDLAHDPGFAAVHNQIVAYMNSIPV